jgi:putative oxidoreductase
MATVIQTWNQSRTQLSERSKVRIGILWALQIASAAMFLFAGTLKLSSAPLMVQEFDAIGIGQWFRYVTGTIEVASAVSLLIPSIAGYGAVALALTMIGAIATHLFVIGGNPAMAIVLLASTSTIAGVRRKGR